MLHLGALAVAMNAFLQTCNLGGELSIGMWVMDLKHIVSNK